jgi:dihydroflavonol-4-reductase
MKYLVTGATGLLGNNIVRQLLAAGEPVRVLARTASDPRPLAGLNVEVAQGDVRDAASVVQACQGIDAVIHSAGYVHIGWKHLDLHTAINVEGTRNVATAAREAGARMVHVSTVNALGLGPLDSPADEDSALPGIEQVPYVLTTRAAEEVVLSEVSRGLWAAIVHPATMFGPWDWKPSSGQMLLEVTRFCLLAPVGSASFCDVRDVAGATVGAVERGQSGRRYILAGHNLTYRDFWQRIAALVRKRGPRLPMGPVFRAIAGPVCDLRTAVTGRETAANSAALAMGRQSHCFSSARAERELGYSIRPLDQTLADAWQWFGEHGYLSTGGKK